MKRSVWNWFVPILFFAACLQGQTSSFITEDEFLSILNDQHPAAAVAAQDVVRAKARLTAAQTLENPQLDITYEGLEGPQERTEWAASWQPPSPARKHRIEAREGEFDASKARQEQRLREIRLQMKRAFADWAFSDARARGLKALAGRMDDLADRERKRAEQGEASGLDVHRLSLAALDLRARAALVRADARERHAAAAALYPDLPAEAIPVLPVLSPPPTRSDDPPPLLREASAELDAAESQRRAAQRFWEAPTLTLGLQQQSDGFGTLEGPVASLSWKLPIFARNRPEKALADARVAEAEARQELLRAQIDAELEAALAAYDDLVAAHADALAVVEGNEQMLRGAEAAFRYGEAALTDLLDAVRAAAAAEASVLDLHEAAAAARRNIEQIQ